MTFQQIFAQVMNVLILSVLGIVFIKLVHNKIKHGTFFEDSQTIEEANKYE